MRDFVPLFVEEIHIPGAKPIMAPTNVGGGGGSVGVLTITWKVSIYKNPLYRKGAGKSLRVEISRFESIQNARFDIQNLNLVIKS